MKPIAFCAAAALTAVLASGCTTATARAVGSSSSAGSTGAAAGSTSVGSGATAAASPGASSTVPGAAASGAGSTGGAPGASATSCHQQFTSWQNGPDKLLSEQITLVVDQVQAAVSAQDAPVLAGIMRQAGKLAGQLQAHPMPTCADPKHYWAQVLGYLRAAGNAASTKRGVTALVAAAAPLQKIPAVEAQLSSELQSTALG